MGGNIGRPVVSAEIGNQAKERQVFLFCRYIPPAEIGVLSGVKVRADKRISGKNIARREILGWRMARKQKQENTEGKTTYRLGVPDSTHGRLS